jgi:6-phosphofructokinase 1
VLAARFGVAALDAAVAGRLGEMVGVRGSEIVEVPLEGALPAPRLVDPELYETAEVFFG